MRRTQSVTLFNSHAARLGAKAKNRPINTDCLPHHPWLRMNEPPGDGSQQEYACQQMRDDGREPNQNGSKQLKSKQRKKNGNCCKPERQPDEFHPRFPLYQKSSYGIEGFPSDHNCLTSSWIAVYVYHCGKGRTFPYIITTTMKQGVQSESRLF